MRVFTKLDNIFSSSIRELDRLDPLDPPTIFITPPVSETTPLLHAQPPSQTVSTTPESSNTLSNSLKPLLDSIVKRTANVRIDASLRTVVIGRVYLGYRIRFVLAGENREPVHHHPTHHPSHPSWQPVRASQATHSHPTHPIHPTPNAKTQSSSKISAHFRKLWDGFF
jgi:hypothetical protein